MRLHAFILAACVCAHHIRAASIPDNKFDLDNVDLEDEQPTVLKEDSLRNTNEVISVKIIDENSNDYIPPYDTSVNVKRVEVDLTNPGLPQRQEHETQNPENFSDNDKIFVAIKHTIEQAENAFNEGLKSVSASFKTFLKANEDLPAIRQSITNLKESFTGQIEKLNETIKTYIKPETATSGESAANSKLEIVQARLKFLDNNFNLGLDTLTEGVELYSIMKEEDEAEKAIALKADVKAEPEVVPSDPASGPVPDKPVDKPAPANPAPANPAPANPAPANPAPANPAPANPAPANPAPANNQPPAVAPTLSGIQQFIENFQHSISSSLQSFLNTWNPNNANTQNAQPGSGSVFNLFQGISLPTIFPGQNSGGQAQVPAVEVPAGQGQPLKPSNTQADAVSAPAPAPPAPWTPQGIFQSVSSTVTSTWNNLVNPGQNNQQPPQQQQQQPQQQQSIPQQPTNTNPIQQAIQNLVSYITPQTPQAPQPVKPANPSSLVAAVAPETVPQKAPESAPIKTEAVSVQGSNNVPAPVNEQPQEQAPPNQANPAPAQAGPIQQLVQNNPIIKGIQSAVQRIQGTPNPETPREEVIKENQDKEKIEDPKGHFHGGHWSENNVTNQGDSGASGRVENKVEEEKVQNTPCEEKEVLEEPLKPEELKTPVADKTE